MSKNRTAERTKSAKIAPHVDVSSASPLVEAAARRERKLDLGCGQRPKEGFEGVDIHPGPAKHVVDLFKFPWPFESDSVDEIHASHLLEHVPAREVEERDLNISSRAFKIGHSYLGADMLFAFVDECYRILKADSWMHVVVPSGRSNRAFWDPTHRRFFMQETCLYFSAEWRKMNGLDHYRVGCNFGVEVTHSLPNEEGLRAAEVQSDRFHHMWNVTVDWIAKLKKLPASGGGA